MAQPSASLVKACLIHSSQPVPSMAIKDSEGSNDRVQSAGDWPSPAYGFGRIALDNVIKRAGSAVKDFTLDISEGTLMGGQTSSVCYTVSPGGSLKATLVWTDLVGSPSAGRSLVNDLNLVVWRGDDGFEWRGNNAVEFDGVNTVESVYLTNPGGATYGVAVNAARVTQMSQSYSLVVTGQFTKTVCTGVGQCPLNCAGSTAGTCAGGTCMCTGGASGADCSARQCPNNCGGNGVCDTATGKCVCGRGWDGPGCGNQLPPQTTIITKLNVKQFNTGISTGFFAGMVVMGYFIGCFCALFCGGFIGAQMMKIKRDRQMSR